MKCKRCKGRGCYYDRHFQQGGTPGICGWCHGTGEIEEEQKSGGDR